MIAEEDPRFMHLKKKISLFAGAALTLVVAVVVLIGIENDLFTKKYELTFSVAKGTGFTRGMPVKLSGFRIGRVKSISLNESATVDIVLQIDKKYQKWIKKDSTARLVKEGLVGEQIVELTVGSPEQAQLADGEQLVYVKTKSLDEMADEIAEKVKPVLSEVRDIIGYVNDPNGDIKQSIRNISILTRNLEDTRRSADTLLIQAKRDAGAVSGKAGSLLDDSSRTLERLDKSLARIDSSLPPLLEHLDATLTNAEKISADVRLTSEQVLPRVPGLVKDSEEALLGTNEIVEAVQGMWPIRGRMKRPQDMVTVPGDSHE